MLGQPGHGAGDALGGNFQGVVAGQIGAGQVDNFFAVVGKALGRDDVLVRHDVVHVRTAHGAGVAQVVDVDGRGAPGKYFGTAAFGVMLLQHAGHQVGDGVFAKVGRHIGYAQFGVAIHLAVPQLLGRGGVMRGGKNFGALKLVCCRV